MITFVTGNIGTNVYHINVDNIAFFERSTDKTESQFVNIHFVGNQGETAPRVLHFHGKEADQILSQLKQKCGLAL